MIPSLLGLPSLTCEQTKLCDIILFRGSYEETAVVTECCRGYSCDCRKIVRMASPFFGKRNPLTELIFMGGRNALRCPTAIRIREHHEIDSREFAWSGHIEINNSIHPINGLRRNFQNPIMEKVIVQPIIPKDIVGQNFGHACRQLFFQN